MADARRGHAAACVAALALRSRLRARPAQAAPDRVIRQASKKKSGCEAGFFSATHGTSERHVRRVAIADIDVPAVEERRAEVEVARHSQLPAEAVERELPAARS